MPETNGSGGVNVKYWQLILVLALQLAGLAYGYGRISQNVEIMQQQLNEVQTHVENARIVSRDEFEYFRTEIRDDVKQLNTAILAVK